MKTLHQAFLHTLEQLYTTEKELVIALPKMAKAATHKALKAGFTEHLEQTKEHVTRLEEAATSLGETFRTMENPVIEALLQEGEKIIKSEGDSSVKDAALIAAAQQVEHYEMAVYCTVVSWAKTMEHDEVADLLKETLDEETKTEEKLSLLAKGNILKSGINKEAIEVA